MRKTSRRLIAVMLTLALAVANLCVVQAAPSGSGVILVYDEAVKDPEAEKDTYLYCAYDMQSCVPIEGLSYNESTNTLTLTNYKAEDTKKLMIYAMGADFKLKLVGDNQVSSIVSQAGKLDTNASMRICGSGSLTLTALSNPITVFADNTESRVVVEKDVKLSCPNLIAAREWILIMATLLKRDAIVFEGNDAENKKVETVQSQDEIPERAKAYIIVNKDNQIEGSRTAYKCTLSDNTIVQTDNETDDYWLVWYNQGSKTLGRLCTLKKYSSGLSDAEDITVAAACKDSAGNVIEDEMDLELGMTAFCTEHGYKLCESEGSGDESDVTETVFLFDGIDYQDEYNVYTKEGDNATYLLSDSYWNDRKYSLYKLVEIMEGTNVAVPVIFKADELPAGYTKKVAGLYNHAYYGGAAAAGGSSQNHKHEYADTWTSDASGHWKECKAGDGEKREAAAHTYVTVIDKVATTEAEGSKHDECSACGYKKVTVTIPKLKKTTEDKDTNAVVTVKNPGKVVDGEVVGAEASYTKPAQADKKVVVPDSVTINGVEYAVTTIEKDAFKGDKKVESVTIGDNVTTIDANAFSGCAKLKTVTIGSNVEKIGTGAFANNKKLTTVKMGDSVTSVGNNAFSKCTSLKKVTLPDSVKTVGKNAFAGCTKLTQATVGKKVTSIGANAFSGNKKLKTVTIKSTKIKTIGKDAFKGLPKNATIKVPKSQYNAIKKKLTAKTGFKKTMKLKKI